MRKRSSRPSLSSTTLIYTITLSLLVQLIFVLFAISAIQRTQFGSLAEFSVGVLTAAHTVPGQTAPEAMQDTFCAESVEINDRLIELLNQGLIARTASSSDGRGILSLAYNCVNKKATSLDSIALVEGVSGPRISMTDDREGGIEDLINGLTLLWHLLTDRASTITTIEYRTMGSDASVLLSFNRSYLISLLTGLLSQYSLATLIVISLNILFVMVLVRSFVTKPIRHLTNSLQGLTRSRPDPSTVNPVEFQFREIHEANLALEAISDLLESRRTIEDRKEGMNHEIRNDLQRLYGQIYRLDLPERVERILHLSLDRLSNRLGDILEFVTWHKGELKRETINLVKMVERCAELSIDIGRYLVDDESRSPVLVNTIPDDITVWSNREGLRIILENLFRNSVDAYNTESKVELCESILRQLAKEKVSTDMIVALRQKLLSGEEDHWDRVITIGAVREGPAIRITITDNADGIQSGLRDSIFLRGVTSNVDGDIRRGIGLLFVKILVEDLGGTITLKSTRHRDDISRELSALPATEIDTVTSRLFQTGTTFEITLPAA